MKKLFTAAVVAGALTSVAHADPTVTIYGILDAGVMSSNIGGTRTTAYQDSQLAPSVLGFMGQDDLGDGLKAGFLLEAGLDLGNGGFGNQPTAASQAPGAPVPFFGRGANLYIGNEWGTITVGNQIDPAFTASKLTEARAMADSFSMLNYWVVTTGHNGPQGNSGGVFDVNSISYAYSGYGLIASIEHSFGGAAGDSSANAGNTLAASYVNSGFTMTVSYAENNDATGKTGTKIDVFGVGYRWGDFALRAQTGEFRLYANPPVVAAITLDDVKVSNIGLDWKVSVSNKLNLAYYTAKDTGFTATNGTERTIALLDVYSLSKRTKLFAQIASLHADAGAGHIIDADIVTTAPFPATGGSGTAIGFGMQQSF